jgi:hypothetical protein
MRIAWLALICLGCGPMLPDGRVYSNSPGLAAANVGVGAVLYVAAGGCKISGCPTNTRCNVSTERCDPIQCDKKSCDPDSVCDEQTGKCIPAGLKTTTASTATTTTPAVPTPPVGPNSNN